MPHCLVPRLDPWAIETIQFLSIGFAVIQSWNTTEFSAVGTLRNGFLWILIGSGGVCQLTPFCYCWCCVRPNVRAGNLADVALGFDTLAPYMASPLPFPFHPNPPSPQSTAGPASKWHTLLIFRAYSCAMSFSALFPFWYHCNWCSALRHKKIYDRMKIIILCWRHLTVFYRGV